jgi:hypothetical protein
MNPFHLGALGVLSLAASAVLLAKAFFWPSFPRESAQTFLGSNPFQVRNTIVQRNESIAGILWLSLGVVVSLLGIATDGEPTYLIGRTGDLLLLLLLVYIAGYISLVITRAISRRQYLPHMIDMQKEGFQQACIYLTNEGRTADEISRGLALDDQTRRHRLSHATGILDQIGKLIDVPRERGQDDQAYSNALLPFFDTNFVRTAARNRAERNWAPWVQAIGTVVLVGITGWYAWLTHGLLQVQVEPDIEFEIGHFPQPQVFIRNEGKYPILDISMEANNYAFLGPPRNQLMSEMKIYPSATPGPPWWHLEILGEQEVQAHSFEDVAENVIGQIQQLRAVQARGALLGISPNEKIQFVPAIIFRMKYHRKVDQKVFRKEKAVILLMDTTSGDNSRRKWFPVDAESTGALQYKEIAEQLIRAMPSRH